MKEAVSSYSDLKSACLPQTLETEDGEGNGNPLHYFYLGDPMDRGARQATIHGVTKTPVTPVIEHTSTETKKYNTLHKEGVENNKMQV